MKKIVTVIVASLALCFMLSLSCEAATTKATTNEKKVSSTKNQKAKTSNKKKKAQAKTSNSKKSTAKNTSKSTSEKAYSADELRYMTSIIYCEARGESYAGQKAVGIVVMNRVRSKEFPNSIKKVIYQSGQFSPVRNGSLDRAYGVYDKQNKKNEFTGEMKSCLKAAKEVLEGSTTITVDGEQKEMKSYLFFSQKVKGAKYQLGAHQFK